VLGCQWQDLLTKGQCGRQWVQPEPCSGTGAPGFLVLSLMEPLHQATFVILQIIMSLRTVSIGTCNKLCEIMMPFHGQK
jgi:hypothetical protein